MKELSIKDLKGIISAPRQLVTVEKMNEAIRVRSQDIDKQTGVLKKNVTGGTGNVRTPAGAPAHVFRVQHAVEVEK